tara:strand:+ start:604 stop:993 length:390 start_codon:yes stop_codon:yes gene_type:complete
LIKMDAKQEYIIIITEFINKTSAGNLQWKKQNPSTLYIETVAGGNEPAVISIQKIQERRRERVEDRVRTTNVEYYVFSVKKPLSKELVIQIDSSSDKSYHGILSELFQVADYKIEKRSIDFLRGIMDNL